MDIKRLVRIGVTLMLVFGIIALVASPASAVEDDRYSCPVDAGGTGDWNSEANWDTNAACTDGNTGVPGVDDRVFIQSGQTCNVDISDTVDTLDVASTAKLVIETGNILTLDGTHDLGVSTIAGNVELEGSGSEIAIILKDHALDGNGSITGYDTAAEISVSGATVDLVNEITIHGTLSITGDGRFDNRGTVRADGGTSLDVNLQKVADAAGATWEVAPTLGTICATCLPSASILHFGVLPGGLSHTLAGDFKVTSGALDVDATMTTTGQLTHNSGSIDVDSLVSCVFHSGT